MIDNDDLYTILDIENPFPCGVPERVMKQMKDLYDKLDAEYLAPGPEFKIDCTSLMDSDFVGAADAMHDYLLANHCEDETANIMFDNVMRQWWLYGIDLRWITAAWAHDLGWHIKVARVKPEVGFGKLPK